MIIGISGKKQHGKDTVGKIVQYLTYYGNSNPTRSLPEWEALGKPVFTHGWQIKHFADPLKKIVCLLIGCTLEELENNDFKEKPLGEEWRIWRGEISIGNGRRRTVLFDNKGTAQYHMKQMEQGYGDYVSIYNTILTPRLLLQLIGTECGRQIIHPNIWINALMSEYKGVIGTITKSAGAFKIPNSTWYTTGEQAHIPKELWNKQVSTSRFEWQEKLGGEQFPNWVITDLRFPNELQAVESRGGFIIRVNKTKLPCYCGVKYENHFVFNERGEPTHSTYRHIYRAKELDQHESETALDNHQFKYTINNDGTLEELVEQVKQILITEKIIQ